MAESTPNEREKDARSFDRVAALYDKFRPDYPQALVESVIALSHLPEQGRILEIGSGTGKATRLFASRDYSIHCIEPGRHLAALAARNLQAYPNVSFEVARFEDCHEQPAEFDLVMSAQAFHWVHWEMGYPKSARALKPGGSLALFWNMHTGFRGQIAADLEKIYRDIAHEMDNPQVAIEETIQERMEEISQSCCFGPVTVRRFPWSQTSSTSDYIGLINTHSDHLRLPAQTRQRS